MIVLFENGEARLLVSGIKRDAAGNIQFADVVNGGWRLEVRNGELLAKSENYIVTRQKLPDWTEMEIPSDVKGDYNKIMCWAQDKYEQSSS